MNKSDSFKEFASFFLVDDLFFFTSVPPTKLAEANIHSWIINPLTLDLAGQMYKLLYFSVWHGKMKMKFKVYDLFYHSK